MKYAITLLLALALAAPVYAVSKTDQIQSQQIRALMKNNAQQNRWIARLRKQMDKVIANITTYKTLHAFDANDDYIGPVTGTQLHGQGSQTVKIYIAELASEVAFNWYHFPLAPTREGFDTNDGFGQFQVDPGGFVFEETECRGEVYVRRNFFAWPNTTIVHPMFLNLGLIYRDAVYVWDQDAAEQLIDIYSIHTPARFSSGGTHDCGNVSEIPVGSPNNFPDEFYPDQSVLRLIPIGPWDYKLPITLELQ